MEAPIRAGCAADSITRPALQALADKPTSGTQHQQCQPAVRYGAATTWLYPAICESIRDDYQRRRPKYARDWPSKKNGHPPGAPKLRRIASNEINRIYALLEQEPTAA